VVAISVDGAAWLPRRERDCQGSSKGRPSMGPTPWQWPCAARDPFRAEVLQPGTSGSRPCPRRRVDGPDDPVSGRGGVRSPPQECGCDDAHGDADSRGWRCNVAPVMPRARSGSRRRRGAGRRWRRCPGCAAGVARPRSARGGLQPRRQLERAAEFEQRLVDGEPGLVGGDPNRAARCFGRSTTRFECSCAHDFRKSGQRPCHGSRHRHIARSRSCNPTAPARS
jgi:hypothetical protein